MHLDHVLIAVSDLHVAARELESRRGLASVEGGRHLDWGTANRIIPLGRSYLELIAVVDPAVAAEQALGRWVAGSATTSGRPLGWAVRTDDVKEVAGRLGLEVRSGSRVTPTGEVLRWRSAGVDRAIAEPSLPFYIEWSAGVTLPGAMPISHPAGSPEITELLVSGDAGRLAAWLGDSHHGLPIVVRPGPPSIAAVVLRTAGGEVVLGDPASD